MKYNKILFFVLPFLFSLAVKGQTVISFEFALNSYDDPHRFDNSGCYLRFGPNPVAINGHNVRAQGALMLTWRGENGYYGINMNARGNAKNTVTRHDNYYYNTTLSIEYLFKANRSYQIAMHGINDYQIWLEGSTKPTNYLVPVFWVRLDNDPNIYTTAPNRCDSWLDPVEKKVDRYSKLITDPNRTISKRDYTVKFSPLEDMKSVKITYDPSPADPDFSFDSIFKLHHITITELPYQEDITAMPFYYNVPADVLGSKSRNNPLYQIDYKVPTRKTDSRTGETTIDHNFTISPYQWLLTNNIATFTIPNLNASRVNYLTALGNIVNSGRTQGREQFNLPNIFENNSLTYEIVDGDLIIKSKNDSNTTPANDIDFSFMYTLKK